MRILYRFFFPLLLMVCTITAAAQQKDTTIKLAAGPEYQRSAFYQSLWGHNYRKEWTTPTQFPVLMLDTMYGGLTPYKEGGGHQSKSLHLVTKEGKEYAMRSVNKNLRVIIPEVFHNTFVAHIADDEISMSYPYAALAVPVLAEAAKIYHTYPRYFFIPKQPALDTFNKVYGNTLYLLEQRPSGDWSDADNLGNFKKFYSSADVLEDIFQHNDPQVDQNAFVKARLFDMFLGDWDRHEDQWKWGTEEKENGTVYIPVPVDRDQPFSKYDGLLLKSAMAAAGAKYFQSFDYDIPYPEGFSYERKNLDRFFTNKITLDQWQNSARELQQELTDASIEKAIRQLPAAIFQISGNDIISKLKSRRSNLVKYATKYYLFLAKDVDIVGSQEKEYFEVNRVSDTETKVNVYRIKSDQKADSPYYTRSFKSDETGEIRLFGLSGKDVFKVDGNVNKGIKIRIIGGNKNDSFSISGSGKKVHIYDDHGKNIYMLQSRTRLHLSSDSTVHQYDYDAFRPEKKGLMPAAGYNDEDRIFVGVLYGWQHQSFRKPPFAFKQSIGVNYSISQQAISTTYKGIFPKAIGKWDFSLQGGYDAVRWTNFYGLGNETPYFSKPTNYFRMRTAEWFSNIGFNRKIGPGNITFSGFYNTVKILNDSNRFITKDYLPSHPENFRVNHFAGGSFNYNITQFDNPLVPVKGVYFNANARYIRNLKDADRSFFNFNSDLQLYIPVVPKISLALSTGAATVTGTPEFYQYPAIGGSSNLRGYTRDRFRGKTSFYNSNELRFITNIRSYFLNGKAGLVAFFDNGRVWMPDETSNAWHTSYGGGILIAPFNIAFFDITIGKSKETTQLNFRSTFKL